MKAETADRPNSTIKNITICDPNLLVDVLLTTDFHLFPTHLVAVLKLSIYELVNQ